MGVTIHYQGKLKEGVPVKQVIDIGRELALKRNAEVFELDCDSKLLHRINGEHIEEYEGPVSGILFVTHENCEPIILEFDKDGVIQEFCKTQFAGISAHLDIIQLLRDIEPYFEHLTVLDEAGFWETSDLKQLERRFGDFFDAFDHAKNENEKLKGPIQMSNGRIIDLIS